MEASPNEADRPRDERLQALQHLLRSRTLANSEAIRRVLKYIVEASVSGRAGEIKEYTIATEALGRPEHFDPKSDNSVRVQMQRLRKKLDEYYGREGASDNLRIRIPTGHYTPQYEELAQPKPSGNSAEPAGLSPQSAPPAEKSSVFLGWKSFALLLAVSIIALGISVFRASGKLAQPIHGRSTLPSSLACLWKPFIAAPNPPLIIYSNGMFLMSKEGDLYRYFSGAAHPLPIGAKVPSLAGLDRPGPIPPGVGPLYYFDAYTGTGEVVAAARIGQLLSDAGQNFGIKRDGVVSYDDIRGSNVIFLGASLEDAVLRTLPVKGNLVFEEASQPEFVGSLEIRDLRAPPGQPSLYRLQRDEKTGALEGEFALISLLPGVVPGRYIMVVGGISTIGTQAAAEFATSKAYMKTVAKALGGPKPRASPYFQVLLHVQIRNGVNAETSCVLVRKLEFERSVALRVH